MSIIERFSKYLTAIEYPKEKTSWNIAGILKGQNAFYKFDVRNMFNLPNEGLAQKGKLNSQAEKMVLEGKKQWLIFCMHLQHISLQLNYGSIKILFGFYSKIRICIDPIYSLRCFPRIMLILLSFSTSILLILSTR